MYGKELIVVLIAVGAASAVIQGVGKCKSGISGISSFDFDAFSTENGGKWSYKMVPKDEDETAMWLQSKAVEGGKYQATVYKQVGNAPAKINSDQIREHVGNGHVKGKAVSGTNQFDLYFLAYVPGSYACFTICSSDGVKSSDEVFVLSNKDLTDDIRSTVRAIVKSKGLSVELKDI